MPKEDAEFALGPVLRHDSVVRHFVQPPKEDEHPQNSCKVEKNKEK